MFEKAFTEITKEDIDQLLAGEIPADRQLEYVASLPEETGESLSDFLAEVASFANTTGGFLIFGLKASEEAKTMPAKPEYVGLGRLHVKDMMKKLEQAIYMGIEPRIAGLELQHIEGFENGPIIMVKIPRSWAAPHMLKRDYRFYGRNNKGKYPLDVHDLRTAFLGSEEVPERIVRFRNDRLAKILAGQTPVATSPRPKAVLHVVPFARFDQWDYIDFTPFAYNFRKLPMLGEDSQGAHPNRYNFEGFLTHNEVGKDGATCYTQLFRSGAIEAVNADIVKEIEDDKLIEIPMLERNIIMALNQAFDLEKYFGNEPPILVMLSFLGIRGTQIDHPDIDFSASERYPIENNDFILPEILVNDFPLVVNNEFSSGIATLMRPTFDAIWQAAGWERSMSYDKNGEWSEQL